MDLPRKRIGMILIPTWIVAWDAIVHLVLPPTWGEARYQIETHNLSHLLLQKTFDEEFVFMFIITTPPDKENSVRMKN